MIRAPDPRSAGGLHPSPGAALLFVAGLAVLFFSAGVILQSVLGEIGGFLGEWLLLLTPTFLFLRAGKWDVIATLSLRRPGWRALAAGFLLGLGAIPIGWLLGWLQTFVLPIPWEMLEGMDRMLAADSAGRLAWLLVAVALTPALCEEVVFRGLLLGATRELAPWRFLLLNGLVFGAFHLTLGTAVRFLPTAWLGIVIAWAVWRSGSLFVGVLMHGVNNGVVVLAASAEGLPERFTDPLAPPPLWILGFAGLCLVVGWATMNGDNSNPNLESQGGIS